MENQRNKIPVINENPSNIIHLEQNKTNSVKSDNSSKFIPGKCNQCRFQTNGSSLL